MAAIDDEAIPVIVKGDDFEGGTVDATTATAEMAVIAPDTDPVEADWNACTWVTDSTGTVPVYRALGPSPLDLTLVVGESYVIWLRLSDSSGIAVKRCAGLLPII